MIVTKQFRLSIALAALCLSGASALFLAQPSALYAQSREEVALWDSLKDSTSTPRILADIWTSTRLVRFAINRETAA